ncbi:MAG TPA: aminotransferase class V-fold PLP-dependent enzyme [Acidobacteriota bacterium]|nr:aminotransferase class V-fold PLP-dependent enzyme [Acidobacteriota bacterium]
MGIFQEIGVKPFINAVATHTRYGGAIMAPPVVEAMTEAARHSVNLYELQEAAGRAIASMTRNEACYISCGATSGVQLAVAACMVGSDEEAASRLPCRGRRFNVVMQASQQGTEADTAVRNTGAEIRLAGSPSGVTADQLSAAIDSDTAAVVTLDWEGDNVVEVAQVVEAARPRRVPVIVDGADCVPPSSHFWRYTRDCGADALVVSGGKRLRGPQNTGLVLGSRKIIGDCTFLGNPNDRFGRSMKVSKEAMAGIYAAVRHLLANEKEEAEAASARARTLHKGLSGLADVSVRRTGHEVQVRLHAPRLSDSQIRSRLLEGDSPVLAFCRNQTLRIDASLLQPGQETTLLRRLLQVLA